MLSKAEKTSQFIIEKAAPIFNKKGYAATSLSDLMEATGLTKGAIYGNFKNKDEVAVAAFEYNVSMIIDPMAQMVRDKKTAIDKLLVLADYHDKWYVYYAERGGCPMLNSSIEADDNYPLLKKRVAATINNWRNDIKKIIEWGVGRGEIKKGVDAAKLSSLFIALVEGSIMMAKITDDRSHVTMAMERIKEIIMKELKV